LSLRSSQPKASTFAQAARWCGPALAALGLLAVAWMSLPANLTSFVEWLWPNAFAPQRILTLIGLGAACGLVGVRAFAAAVLFFGLGIAGGFVMHDRIVLFLYAALHGPTYLFLTGPISCLAVGLALVPGARPLPWLLPIAALVEGAMLAVAIFLSTPTLDDPVLTWAQLLAAVWIVATVAMTTRAFRRQWFAVFGRILGSWILAIGLLYGAASLVPVFNPPPAPTDTSRESTRGAELNRSVQGPREIEQGSSRSQPQPWNIPSDVEPNQP
jgi:hypothetical protein